MRKHMVITVLILCFLLFSGYVCADVNASSAAGFTHIQQESPQGCGLIQMEEDEQQDHTQEIDAVQTEKDGINGIWHLAEHEGLTVDLITTLDPDTLKPMDYLRILMPEQDNITMILIQECM